MDEKNGANSSLIRGQWSGRLGFILAAAGSAVGLGNIWSFSYKTGTNGGGSFVLVYLICVALVGLPVMIAEIMIGRHSQKSPVGAFEKITSKESNWRFIGFMGILAGFLILSFYSVVAGWTLNYFFMCMVNFFKGRTPEQIRESFAVLQKSPNIQIFWHFIFMLSTLGIVVGGVKKGIEKWSKLLMPALFLLLIALIVYSMIALPTGFGKAIKFTFTPSKLLPSSILEALGQAFFSLSLGMGAMLTYGSYLSKDSNIPKASVSVCFLDTLIALIACMVIFPIVFEF